MRQLTGLGGSSSLHNVNPTVSADGGTIDCEVGPLNPESGRQSARLVVVSGVVEVFEWVRCCISDRDDTDVASIPGSRVDDEGDAFAVVQENVAPNGGSRLVPAPLLVRSGRTQAGAASPQAGHVGRRRGRRDCVVAR